MAAAPGFLEFFILEASDYIERLDALLLGGKPAGPDGDALQRAARALRGTATMAKLPAFAELAAGVERVGRAIHDGSLRWEPALSGAMIAAIDDLKTLLHATRTWSGAEDKRARDRANELARFAPVRAAGTPAGTSPVSSGAASAFLATEAANIAAGLELLTARSGDPETAANVLRRIRALRGVAGVKEVTPLADTLEATEDAARGLETTREAINPETRRLLEAAAGFLRSLSSSLRTGGDVRGPNAARDEFDAARTAVEAHGAERERIIPIARLFYDDDGGAGVVEASPHPPTTAAERFRLELVSLGEHLRQVVSAARDANESASSARAQREVTRALQALEAAAESFGEREIAELIRSYGPTNQSGDSLSRSALDDLAGVLTTPGAQGERLRERLRELAGVKDLDAAIGAGFGKSTPPASSAAPPVRPRAPSATELLDTSISALEAFVASPMTPPSRLEEEGEVVPIESLLYRGRAALDRAVELRDAMKRAGVPSDPDGLEELFDLLELARAD